MCLSRCVEVGVSNAPIAIDVQSRPSGSQNKDDPHLEQKPRRTFADDWYQDMFSWPVMTSAGRGTLVEAK
jgi:hypothetical protein